MKSDHGRPTLSTMSRVKISLSIDSDLLRAVEEEASRTGKWKSEVLEEALRFYFGPHRRASMIELIQEDVEWGLRGHD